ncbi:MAG: sigma-54-dependent Fis family transcriptional regulator [Opitutales bacterium]|nr:sigma-54-dependent Fis family transcriptional regulator [Opitutales bacterium]
MPCGEDNGDRAVSKEAIRLLVADDDQGVLVSARMLFGDSGWKVDTVSSVTDAVRRVEAGEYDVALIDMNYTRNTTAGTEGLDLLAQLKNADPDLPVVVMTAWATVDLAVEALKMGARDFIQKPWSNDRVFQQVNKHALNTRVIRNERRLKEETRTARMDSLPGTIIGQSDAMRQVLDVVEQIAPSDAPVLLLGENGTGKSLLARWIHERSRRCSGPFVNVNIGGLAESLFESEVFGHVKGAFTDAKTDRVGRFELARGGTIFLDEIGNLGLAQQSRLLRLLETGEFERVGSSRTVKAEVRVVSATNAPLRDRVADKAFREDLFYRLNTVTIEMPPLRERREDIMPLAVHFLQKWVAKYRKAIEGFDRDAEQILMNYAWPGNIRELEHALERAVLLCKGKVIEKGNLMMEGSASPAIDLESMSVEDVERVLIGKALRRNGGNVSEAARQLGMSRATFYRRLQSYGL